MKEDTSGLLEFEADDFERASNCFHCKDNFPIIKFDKVKDDYVKIRGISGKPNSCDYVIIAKNVRSRKIEIWLIEEKDIVLKFVQKLKDLKKEKSNITFDIFINAIGEIFERVIYDFIYSATVLSDILGGYKISVSELNDKNRCRFVCKILYRREQLNKVDPILRQVVEIIISSMELSKQAIFITPEDLCSELKYLRALNLLTR